MALHLTLERATTGGGSVRIGTFDRIEVGHRRIRAGETKMLRHFDGGWHWKGISYLAARVEPASTGERVQVAYARPWGPKSPTEHAEAVRLYGDRLLALPTGRWTATDDDDARCWIAERTGLASADVVLAVA